MENNSLELILEEKNPVIEGNLEEIVLKKPIENVFSSNAASSAYILALRDLALKLNIFDSFMELIDSSFAYDSDKEKLKTLLSIQNSSIPKNLSYVNAPTFALLYEYVFKIFKNKGFDFNINDFLIASSLKYYHAHIRIIGAFLPFNSFMSSLQVDLKKLTDAIEIDVKKGKSLFGREYSFKYKVKKLYFEELEEYFTSDFIKRHIRHNLYFTRDFLSLLPVLFNDSVISSISKGDFSDIGMFKGRPEDIKVYEDYSSFLPFSASFTITYPNVPYFLRFKTGFRRLAHFLFPFLRKKEIYNLLVNSFEDNISSIEEAHRNIFKRIKSRVETAITAIDFASSLFENPNLNEPYISTALRELSSMREQILSSEEQLRYLPRDFFTELFKEYVGDKSRVFNSKSLEKIRDLYNDVNFLQFLESKLREKISFESPDFYTDKIISLFGSAYKSVGVSEQPGILNSMIERVDEVDAFKGHSSRVGELFSLLAESYKTYLINNKFYNDGKYKNSFEEFSNFDFETLKLIGALHDIGKLFIRTEVLKKPFKLSDEEFFEIQQHTILGYKLLEAMSLDDVFKYSALYHHKNYSSEGFGANYPSGEGFYDFIVDVPFSSIVSLLRIADSIDAIAASSIDREYDKKRHYRTRTVVDAITTVMNEFGTTYNPIFKDFFVNNVDVVLSFYEKVYSKSDFPEGILAIETYRNQ